MTKIFVYINGEKFILNKEISIKNLLKFLALDSKEIVVEHEKILIEKNCYNKVFLKNYTSIEVLSLVGGG